MRRTGFVSGKYQIETNPDMGGEFWMRLYMGGAVTMSGGHVRRACQASMSGGHVRGA